MEINFNDNVPGVKIRVCKGGNRSTEKELIVHPGCLWADSRYFQSLSE